MPNTGHDDSNNSNEPADRRGFLSTTAMGVGLACGYGTFAVYAGRFLYPAAGTPVGWQYVAHVNELPMGKSLDYTAPSGSKIVIARQTEGNEGENFIALSSVCPHLGCAVHWEAVKDRFFCPCHNGAFDSQGKAIEGPPKSANQELKQFPLKVENDMLFIEVPMQSLANGEDVAAVRRIANPSDATAEADGLAIRPTGDEGATA